MRFIPLAALSLVLALPLVAMPTTLGAQAAAGSTPITSQTPATPNGTDAGSPVATTPSTPMTKDEMKAQHKQQKSQEKAAKDSAKAAKAKEKALKAQNKATNAAEQTQPH